jgi:hypothetical protein
MGSSDLRRCFVVEITERHEKVNVKSLGADAGDLWSLALSNEIRTAIARAIEAGHIGGYALDKRGNLTSRAAEGDLEALKEALRHADTAAMTTSEVVDFCESRFPGCTVQEIARALEEVGDEQLRKAERLSRRFSDPGQL